MDLYKRINQQELNQLIKAGEIPVTETFVTSFKRILETCKPSDLVLQVEYEPQKFYHEFWSSDADNKIYRACTPLELGRLHVDVLSLGELVRKVQ